MPTRVAGQRRTHAYEGDLALFLIGMTVNKPWRPRVWVPTAQAMGPMLRELTDNRAAAERGEATWWGFYRAHTLAGLRGPTVVQFWRAVEDIYRYASDTEAAHRPAWAAFSRRARAHPDVVGIWHETYAVTADGHESIYHSVPEMGLGAEAGTVPVARRGERARERLGASVRAEDGQLPSPAVAP